MFFQNDNINTFDEDSELRLSTMSNMIANPKYKGWYVGNKVRVVDMFTKKQKFLPPEEWVMFKDETGEIVPAIVSEELWELAQRKKAKLLEYNVTGRISDADFLSMTAGCNAEIEAAEQAVRELEEQMESSEGFHRHIEDIRRTLKSAQEDAARGLIGKEFVDRYIDKIYATPEEGGALRLDVKIFTGETTRRHLEKLQHRTGHTFKKMTKAYENGLK